ncbi:MAG: hypothetical protein IPP15_12840 [Saprospiraceae bacterium]|uniref:Uncharacterized protein n=1 Tax=Candidatus Opimibacter skivensis TaxID=2982028 RepID=A0A9D7SUD4_9BACT|nr:hypothetical protein [Candidatus Opimibacter skivensis]
MKPASHGCYFVYKLIFSLYLSVGIIPLFGQNDIHSVKDKMSQKLETIKDSLRSNHFNITGTCNGNLVYTLSREERPTLDYQFNINLKGSYKGLKLPFQYAFSNGRSIYRFNGTSFRLPSFNAIGFSPGYKGYTLLLGNRTMDFSKYSFQNVRFQGMGIQTPEKGLYIKAFSGSLKIREPNDLLYKSDLEPDFNRKSWGGLVGLTTKKIQFKSIVFKANDKVDKAIKVDTLKTLPKENTVISYSIHFEPSEKFSIEVVQALSAFTHNALSPRVNILTPQSANNIFGLFEKKESSDYYSSNYVEAKYVLKEQSISYIYESVDKDYRSLGSLFFDNNFIENRMKVSGILKEKLNYVLSGGLRTIKTKQDINTANSKIVVQSMISYPWSDQLTSYISYNNFKIVQQDYYQGNNSSTVDSLALSQVSSSFSLGSNFVSKEENPFALGLIISVQGSNSIQDEIVHEDRIKNKLISLTYSKQWEKDNINASLSFTNTISQLYLNKTIGGSFMYGNTLTDKIKLSSIFQYQSVSFSNNHVNQLIARGNIEYTLDKNKSLNFDIGLDFSDAKIPFRLNRCICKIDIQTRF